MTTDTVIELHVHPRWLAAERRRREVEEAMRRHPSFQSRLHTATPHLRLVSAAE